MLLVLSAPTDIPRSCDIVFLTDEGVWSIVELPCDKPVFIHIQPSW